MDEADDFWESLALELESLIKHRVEKALPRGGVRDISLAVSIERSESGEISLVIEANVQTHPGVKQDVDKVVEDAISEAFKKADEELIKRGLTPAG